jgi:hypothetical protein
MIARARRHRFGIGLVAAYALLLSALLPAFTAAADPLQATLDAHLCGPSGSQSDDAPAAPSEHQQKCQLCGPSCAMGGHTPVAALADATVALVPLATAAAAPAQRAADRHSPLSLYPSDILSRGPPQAA